MRWGWTLIILHRDYSPKRVSVSCVRNTTQWNDCRRSYDIWRQGSDGDFAHGFPTTSGLAFSCSLSPDGVVARTRKNVAETWLASNAGSDALKAITYNFWWEVFQWDNLSVGSDPSPTLILTVNPTWCVRFFLGLPCQKKVFSRPVSAPWPPSASVWFNEGSDFSVEYCKSYVDSCTLFMWVMLHLPCKIQKFYFTAISKILNDCCDHKMDILQEMTVLSGKIRAISTSLFPKPFPEWRAAPSRKQLQNSDFASDSL